MIHPLPSLSRQLLPDCCLVLTSQLTTPRVLCAGQGKTPAIRPGLAPTLLVAAACADLAPQIVEAPGVGCTSRAILAGVGESVSGMARHAAGQPDLRHIVA